MKKWLLQKLAPPCHVRTMQEDFSVSAPQWVGIFALSQSWVSLSAAQAVLISGAVVTCDVRVFRLPSPFKPASCSPLQKNSIREPMPYYYFSSNFRVVNGEVDLLQRTWQPWIIKYLMPEGDFEMEETRIKAVSTTSTVSATTALPKFKLMMLGTIHELKCDFKAYQYWWQVLPPYTSHKCNFWYGLVQCCARA